MIIIISVFGDVLFISDLIENYCDQWGIDSFRQISQKQKKPIFFQFLEFFVVFFTTEEQYVLNK